MAPSWPQLPRMTFTALASVALLAANPDPGPPVKDCARFVVHYRELLQHQAVVDRQVELGPTRKAPSLSNAAPARLDRAPAAKNFEPDVARACGKANGSQYECVISAKSYGDLASCRLRALPGLDADERQVAAMLKTTPPPVAEERPAAAEVGAEYVRTGNIDIEALGTGSGASGEEMQRNEEESEVVQGGR